MNISMLQNRLNNRIEMVKFNCIINFLDLTASLQMPKIG